MPWLLTASPSGRYVRFAKTLTAARDGRIVTPEAADATELKWEASLGVDAVMSDFETYECTTCGTAFRAYPGANAVTGEPACSPICEQP